MKSLAKENQIRQERKNNYGRKETSSSFSHRTEPKKTKSPTLGEIAERFLRWYKSVREPASYRRHKTSSKPIIKFFRSNNINLQESHQTSSSQRHCDITLNTSLRKRKILSFKWSNVDFETKCIILEPFETKTKKTRFTS